MLEKTQAVFEVNKGTNKLFDIGVNDTANHEDRRVPLARIDRGSSFLIRN
jgi:hypothetical protein